MKIEERTLTVDLAHELLAINTKNRPLKQDAIIRYSIDMMAGLWRETGEPIKIGSDGVLLDGQNRCHALIRANELSDDVIEIPVLIVEGLAPDSQDVMDSGRPRSVPDQLARRGVPYTTKISASIRLICGFTRGTIRLNTLTTAQLLAFYDSNVDAINHAMSLVPLENTSGVNNPVLIAAAYLIINETNDPDAVEEFMNQVCYGTNLDTGSPTLALRTRMQYAKLYRESIPNMYGLHTVLRVWNAHRTGQTLLKLPVRNKKTGKRAFVEKIEP